MSLRTRLLLATALVSLSALALVDAITYVVVSRSQVRQLDDSLERAHEPVEELAMEGSAEALAAIPVVAPGTFVAIVDPSGSVGFVSPVARAGSAPIVVDAAILAERLDDLGLIPDGSTTTVHATDGSRVRLRLDPLDDDQTLVTGQSMHEIDETRTQMLLVLLAATAAAVGIIAIFGQWLVRLGLRPLTRVESEAREITHHDLPHRRVSSTNERTEVGRLAQAINAMLDRLESGRRERETTMSAVRASEARMRQFVADASHELRTPLAATAAYAELFEHGAKDRPADLARAMSGIRTETRRMGALVDDLLALARLDEHPPLVARPVDLTEVILEAIGSARTVAPERAIRPGIGGVVWVSGERTQLRQVIDNLLVNARTHTPVEAVCEVTLRTDGSTAVLTVSDDGPGVPDDELGQIFDRFHRVDAARSRSAGGGSGLGLAIVKSIVKTHGGSIEATTRSPHGLRITVRLPAREAPVSDHDPVSDHESAP